MPNVWAVEKCGGTTQTSVFYYLGLSTCICRVEQEANLFKTNKETNKNYTGNKKQLFGKMRSKNSKGVLSLKFKPQTNTVQN